MQFSVLVALAATFAAAATSAPATVDEACLMFKPVDMFGVPYIYDLPSLANLGGYAFINSTQVRQRRCSQFVTICLVNGAFIKLQSITYKFSVCAENLPSICLPKGYSVLLSYAPAMISWGATPECNPNDNSTLCLNPLTNQLQCCTSDCEPIGQGGPIISPRNPNNLATGGLLLQLWGSSAVWDDPFICPTDPSTGAMQTRSVSLNLTCDPTASTLEISSAYEATPCQYVVEARTSAACGCAINCKDKLCGFDGCGGFCSGESLAGMCPYGQLCQPNGACCRPDCTNRDCGDDGCGGSCGSCPSNETCASYMNCVPQTE
jgi:hypothetical protein